MKRKYAQPIQHTIFKDGYRQALHDVGDAIERLDRTEDSETVRVYVYVEDLEAALGKLVPDR